MSASRKLLDAYDRIQSSKPTVRATGLNDLKRLLGNQQNAQGLNDKGFHKMFEAIFKGTIAEKEIYCRAEQRKTGKDQSLARLSNCGAVLRLAVETGVDRLKSKTVKAVYNHIIDILPHGNNGLCEPISNDYIKALSACLKHATHTEHLHADEWSSIATFCCVNISAQLGIDDDAEGSDSTPSGRRERLLVRDDTSLSRRSVSSSRVVPKVSHACEELIICLQYLVGASNAPILDHKQIICSTLLGFLTSQPSVTRAHQPVLAALNSVLKVIMTNDIRQVAAICDEVVPVITRLWDTKSPGLKDEMVLFLVLCQSHLRAGVLSSRRPTLRRKVNNLLETLCNEYISRADRDLLQLDDLEFPAPLKLANAFSTRSVALRRSLHDFRNEQSWATLQVIACMIEMLDLSSDRRTEVPVPAEAEGTSAKRRKNSTQLEDFLRYVRSNDASRKLLALQVIPFLANIGGISVSIIASVLQDLYDACLDENSTVASWAMIGISSIAAVRNAGNEEAAPIWRQVWQLCCRTITNHPTCRTACHAMRLMLVRNVLHYSSISESVENIIRAADLNGPAVLADSSLALWTCILKKRNTFAQSSRFHPGERLFQWFIAKWQPVDGLERTGGTFYLHYKPHYASARDIIEFLIACAGLSELPQLPEAPFVCGSVGQACLWNAEFSGLQDILLEIYDSEDAAVIPSEVSAKDGAPGSPSQVLSLQIIDLFEQQTLLLHEKWRQIAAAPVQHLTESMMQNFVEFILVASLLCNRVTGEARSKALSLMQRLQETLVEDLLGHLARKGYYGKQIDGILLALSPYLPTAASVLDATLPVLDVFPHPMSLVVCQLSELLEKKVGDDSPQPTYSAEAMDIDDGFGRPRIDTDTSASLPRECFSTIHSAEAFQACCLASIKLCSLCLKEMDLEDICGNFAAYLMGLSTPRLTMTGHVVREFLVASSNKLHDEDAVNFVYHLCELLLQGYDYERCESSLALCISAAGSLVPRWVGERRNEVLGDACEQIFLHALKIGLEKQVTSYQVRISIAHLLKRIVHTSPLYQAKDTPEPIGIFFQLLEDPDVRVTYSIAQTLPVVLSDFSVARQSKLFEEVEKHLPQTREWTEGLAMRVHTLSQLALTNYSVISRIVYRIFETGQLENGQGYAARALYTVARASKLAGQRELFMLFSPKLIFAWTEHYELNDFPFQTFGYASLEDLFDDVTDELVAQLIIKTKYQAIESVSTVLGVPLGDLLVRCFPKVVAYAMLWDAAQKDPTKKEIERLIRKQLGDDKYGTLFQRHLRLIISCLMTLMIDNGIDKFLKDPGNSELVHTMSEITEYGSSNKKLADPLRPFFSVKAVYRSITLIIARLRLENRLWTPAMVSFTVRQMLDTLHPARGPVYACTVIRNIRFLICLAGPVVRQGYILEMLLYGLKPYVVDTHCAEDSVGILKYLLVSGQSHISRVPAFILGFYLSVVACLRDRIHSLAPTVSTPPESQTDQVSVTVARDFVQWLCNYLVGTSFTLESHQLKTFSAIVNSAAGFRDSGNARKDTKESEFLMYLLDDDLSETPLLDDTSRQVAIGLCCSRFDRPETFRADILGDDDASQKRAESILRICRRSDVSDGFLLWSARVLGRSYAASGQLQKDWRKEMEFDQPSGFYTADWGVSIIPRVAIFRSLRTLLRSELNAVVSLAERTLERIIYDESADTDESDHLPIKCVLTREDINTFSWEDIPALRPDPKALQPEVKSGSPTTTPVQAWVKQLCVSMCDCLPEDSTVFNLPPLLEIVDSLAAILLRYVVHIFLTAPAKHSTRRDQISKVFRDSLSSCTEATIPHNKILIECILYLRTQDSLQEIPRTAISTKVSRDFWLDIDYLTAAKAACTCRMFRTALLFCEIHSTIDEDNEIPSELLLEVFRNVDDPDSYYGVRQNYNLSTVLDRFEYERDGWKSLSLRGANLESHVRLGEQQYGDNLGVVEALSTLGMNGVSHSFLLSGEGLSSSEETAEKMFRSAWKLEQWSIPCPPSCQSRSATIYRGLQAVNGSQTTSLPSLPDQSFLEVMRQVASGKQTRHALSDDMRSLAMLTEMEEILVSSSTTQVKEVWERQKNRTQWMLTGRYSDVEEIMSMRRATFGSLAKQEHLRLRTTIDLGVARELEASTLIGSCKMARSHHVLQHALSAATQLTQIIGQCKRAGIEISAVAALQVADVLWEDGQAVESIRMLRNLEGHPECFSQTIPIGHAKLLAKIGSWTSEARVEKPDKIMENYLERAIAKLNGKSSGAEAGRVFHEFAAFCDQQLQNPGNVEDFERARKLTEAKKAEQEQLAELARKEPGRNEYIRKAQRTVQVWLTLDEQEYNRLRESRDRFLEKSITNYLRCLAACDGYDSDAVRFCALWLANSDDANINTAAGKVLGAVSSRKFVPMVNQLSSRLLFMKDKFQSLLLELMVRICKDHPFHAIFQILALTKSNREAKDSAAASRHNAATEVVRLLRSDDASKAVYLSLESSSTLYHRLATAKLEKRREVKPVDIKTLLSRDKFALIERIGDLHIPPPTMHVEVRVDCDYSDLPVLSKFEREAAIASGLSAPKIIRCQATDGNTFKMLVKAGNDDLRQDAIMEQVFEQVSVLLYRNRITRQRDLKVRTYTVIPLTKTSGVIEFVPNTVPLHDWLFPAHARYRPKDLKHTDARKFINDAQNKSRETRVSEYRKATKRFKPVLRYFFMHEFNGPDEWYSSQLAYTRSTAAISILGHVLGLGDRHGHNILLDKKTGEVVHIDLGVAFDQGRILPVPEVVPFRLTRDIVDGMGVTKTEGVFRRCCEFTLEVLRNEAYNITTILDVLRYDPLYSWTLSPLRAQRMQDKHLEEQGSAAGLITGLSKPKSDSESEADRALTVVAKKLSKTLSVGATVNELIQQAGDEKNLALLYSGWAAYA